MADDFARTLRARADAVPDVVAVSTAEVLEGVRRRRRARRARRSAGAAALVVAVGAGVWTWGGQPAAPEVTVAEEAEGAGAADETDSAEAPTAERLSTTDEVPADDTRPTWEPMDEEPQAGHAGAQPTEATAGVPLSADAGGTAQYSAHLSDALSRTCREPSRSALAAMDGFLPRAVTAAAGLGPLLRACLD